MRSADPGTQDALSGNSGIERLAHPRLLALLKNKQAYPHPLLDMRAPGDVRNLEDEKEDLEDEDRKEEPGGGEDPEACEADDVQGRRPAGAHEPTIDWAECLPDSGEVRDLQDALRDIHATQQTRVAIAQCLAHALSLAESSNAQHHCGLVGVRFARVYAIDRSRVLLELDNWTQGSGRADLRELLNTVTHPHLPHSFLGDDAELDDGASRVYFDHMHKAVQAQGHRPLHRPLTKLPVPHHDPAGSVRRSAAVQSFHVGSDQRLALVGTARSKLSGEARSLMSSAQGGTCNNSIASRQRRGGGGGGGGGFGGRTTTGSAASRRGHGTRLTCGSSPSSAYATRSSTASTRPSQQRPTPSVLGLDLGLDESPVLPCLELGPDAIDISHQRDPDDETGMNAANVALPLGVDAATYAAAGSATCALSRMQDEGPDCVDDLNAALRMGPDAVKQWVGDPRNVELVLEICISALEAAGCEVVIVSPGEMDRLQGRTHHRPFKAMPVAP